MTAAPLPIEALPAWASLYGVGFFNVELKTISGKGIGLAATQRLSLAAGHEGAFDDAPLLKVPRDLVLSSEAVERYAKIDHNFGQLLDAAGHRSTRGDILLYLFVHLLAYKSSQDEGRVVVSNSWTEYIKFLPREILVPTLWTAPERSLLEGTSLESAVHAKMAALSSEIQDLREKASSLPFWDSLLRESGVATMEDWALVDAWYRSRCLELPSVGEVMVPCVDMANHSNEPDAYYDEDTEGDVEILLRPGFSVASGDEVTISYGEFKSAAEMLFSYGFIDKNMSKDDLTLILESFPDDPLAQAKVHIFGSLPTLRLSRTGETLTWESPFVYLMCLNEEDGLDFRILQDTDGNRELRLFWQEDDVTDRAGDFESLIRDHPYSALFQLRVVTVLAQQLTSQLERIRSPRITERPDLPESEKPALRDACLEAAETLREIEGSLLEAALAALGEQQSTLLADEKVKSYLGSTEATQNEEAPAPASNEDEDFS